MRRPHGNGGGCSSHTWASVAAAGGGGGGGRVGSGADIVVGVDNIGGGVRTDAAFGDAVALCLDHLGTGVGVGGGDGGYAVAADWRR